MKKECETQRSLAEISGYPSNRNTKRGLRDCGATTWSPLKQDSNLNLFNEKESGFNSERSTPLSERLFPFNH
jgi:hypothetical protein